MTISKKTLTSDERWENTGIAERAYDQMVRSLSPEVLKKTGTDPIGIAAALAFNQLLLDEYAADGMDGTEGEDGDRYYYIGHDYTPINHDKNDPEGNLAQLRAVEKRLIDCGLVVEWDDGSHPLFRINDITNEDIEAVEVEK